MMRLGVSTRTVPGSLLGREGDVRILLEAIFFCCCGITLICKGLSFELQDEERNQALYIGRCSCVVMRRLDEIGWLLKRGMSRW
jgi:hypothetical protein